MPVRTCERPFVIALVAYLLAAALGLWWCWLTATPLRLRGEPELSAPQIALLRRRGRRAALIAAVTELYVAGLVEVHGSGRLARGDAAMAADRSELARAVYRVLVVPRSLHRLAFHAPVRAALRAAADELARSGAAPTRTRWRLSRLALVGVVAVTLVGVTRAGALPPPLVLPAMVLVASALVAWFWPRRTVAGARLLRRLRQEQATRWADPSGPEPFDSWTPQQAAWVSALTGMVLSGLEPALQRETLDREPGVGRPGSPEGPVDADGLG